ncbi:hypothetical protein GCM10010149_87950 [Nonomuraea roseoviolacea subsp. roseoviolacea]|uniref:hypothetical protein n=1 Tax=Nonomuraea roseoviolacea TaxID=103837 RepID=UPI0031CE9088
MPSYILTIVSICGVITAIGAAVVVLVKGLALVVRWVKRLNEFLDDWNGEPERPGVPARLGVMTRLEQMETKMQELEPNHGGSIKDAVGRIDANLDQLRKDFDAHVSSTSS